MDVMPKNVGLLLKQMREDLGAEAAVISLSTTIFKFEITNSEVILFFYRNLTSHIDHMIELLTDSRHIHIDEDLFLLKNEIIMARIGAALGKAQRIYARDTTLVRINKEEVMAFQQAHHLQVSLPGKYRYGLFHRDILVSIAVFSGGRKMLDKNSNYRSFELLRFCHRTGYLVVGGLSKLLKGFIRQFEPDDIMTYVDRDWSDGSNYKKVGFESGGTVPSQTFFINARTGRRYDIKAFRELGNNQDRFWHLKNLGSIKMRYTV